MAVRFGKLLLATHNQDKVKEICHHLDGLGIEIVTTAQYPQLLPVEEDQPTLQGNAIKKAQSLSLATGMPALADDTGLEVDALNGAPGVYSSRYAGEQVSYAENVDKLLRELLGVPLEKRTARFRCVIAVADGNAVETVDGVCEGVILSEHRGQGGFGYDPVFLEPKSGLTFAEMTLAEKNLVSHRGVALAKARAILTKRF